MSTKVPFVALLLISSFVAHGEEAGRLCILDDDEPASRGAKTCLQLGIRDSGEVAPSSVVRRYVWFSPRGRSIIAGSIATGSRVAEPAADKRRPVELSIRPDAGEWPERLTAELHVKDGSVWRWSMDPAGAAALQLLEIPPGPSTLRLIAEHHREHVVSIGEGADPVRVGTVFLLRIPTIAGEVVDAQSRSPIPSALVSFAPGGPVVMTEPDGGFFVEIGEGWPESVRIDAKGHGSRLVLVPKRVGDTDLGALSLPVAGGIRVNLDTPRTVGAEVYAVTNDGRKPHQLASRDVDDDVDELLFDHLAPGSYHLLLRGPEPLQRYVLEFEVEEGLINEKEVSIDAGTLTLRLRMDGEPLPHTRVELRRMGTDQWESNITVDGEGAYETEFWQRGAYGAVVSVDGRVGFFATRDVETSDVDWLIEISGISVRGIVVDESAEPIPGAWVDLEWSQGRRRSRVSETGEFEFGLTQPGSYTVEARAQGYLRAREVLEVFPDTPPTVRLVLAQPVSKRIVVTDSRGAPLAGSAIVSSGEPMPLYTDERGSVAIALQPREDRIIFVVPRQGSFAVVRVNATDKADTVTVPIPAGEATIGIRATTTAGASVPEVRLMMRYNGYMFPGIAAEALARQQSAHLQTGAHGVTTLATMPLGHYEFWPVFTAEQRESLLSGTAEPAPVQLIAKPGPNWVTLRFARQSESQEGD